MKVNIQYHKDGNTQSDFIDGALTIHCADPETSFALGQIFNDMVTQGKEVVKGTNHGGIFIRVPLKNK